MQCHLFGDNANWGSELAILIQLTKSSDEIKATKKPSIKNSITLIHLGEESLRASMIFKLTLTEGALCGVSGVTWQ